jgi:hypothetical protein
MILASSFERQAQNRTGFKKSPMAIRSSTGLLEEALKGRWRPQGCIEI